MILKNPRRRPPGPVNLLGPIGLTWRHALLMVFAPLRFMTTMANRYGDLTHFRLFGRRGYLLNHPDLIAQVLIHEAEAFEKLPRQINVIRQIFGKGILVTEGHRWKLDRQHLQRAFGKPLVERNIAATNECTDRMLDRWASLKQILLVQEMNRLTAAISLLAFVSEDDQVIVDQLSQAVVYMSDEFSSEMNSAFRSPDWLPLPNKRRKRESLKFYNDLFDQLIASRRSSSVRRDDFLQYLIDQPQPAGTDANFVRDQLLTILIAAYHASSMALVWIFHLLESHAEVELRLLEELATNSSDAKHVVQLPYLKSVIAESLRLYPPAWALFARRSLSPVTMRGYTIAKGGWFYISPFVTHRSEEFFPDPLTFDPDRFSPARVNDIPKHAYFPFGLGGRSCIGSRLALDQLLLVTASILNRFRLRRADRNHEPKLIAKLALRPRDDIPIILERSPLAEWADVPLPRITSGSFACPTTVGSKV